MSTSINRFYKLTITLLLILIASACDTSPPLRPLSQEAKILAFGDSITLGYGVEKGQDYPSQLQQLVQRTVINAGVSGEVSEEGLRRLPDLLIEHQPELLILMHGGNDILRKLSTQQLKANIEAMIIAARQEGIEVLLLGVPKLTLPLSAHPLYEELAGRYEIVYEEDMLADILSSPSKKLDRVHPNTQGYQQLANEIFDLLKKRGAI